jgi:hypothetical protein
MNRSINYGLGFASAFLGAALLVFAWYWVIPNTQLYLLFYMALPSTIILLMLMPHAAPANVQWLLVLIAGTSQYFLIGFAIGKWRTDGAPHVAVSRRNFLLPGFVVFAFVLAVLISLALPIQPYAPPSVSSDVRVRNLSSFQLHFLKIGGQIYGDVGPGETTAYRNWGPAYSSSGIWFQVDNRQYSRTPDDYLGEPPLGTGHFTFVINLPSQSPGANFSVEVTTD